jgi:hypothetical protein
MGGIPFAVKGRDALAASGESTNEQSEESIDERF